MLQSDLVRQGQDLAFDTDLVYLDVINRRLGVNNTNANTTVSVTGDVNAHYYYGIIGTVDQPLITNVGTLGNLTVSGNITAGNLYGNINGNISGNIIVPGSNTQVVFNNSGLLGASSGFTFDKATNIVVISGNAEIGNLTTINGIFVTGTNISTVNTNANIYLSPTGTGIVQITGTGAFSMPAGTTAQEPSGVPTGSLRFNTDTGSPEFFNGVNWISLTTSVSFQTFSGNGTGNTYPLNQSTTAGGIIVSLNGVQQTPNVAYTVNGSSITFAEIPETTDVVDIRYIASGQTIAVVPDFTQAVTISNTLTVSQTTTVNSLVVNSNVSTGNISSTGNVSANYFIGNGSLLTGIVATGGNYSNSNVASYLPTYSGNLTAGNISSVGRIISNDTTQATGTGTGAVVIVGGASVTKDFWVGGNLYTTNLIAVSTANITVQDPLLYLTANTPYPYSYEIGFYSQFNPTGTNYQHTGFIRDHADNVWKLVSNITEPTGQTVDFTNANVIYDSIKTGNATVGNLISLGNISGSYVFGNGSQLTSVAATTAGTAQYVTQAAQSNITSVGVLSSLTSSGNITASNLISNNSVTVSNAVAYSPSIIYINSTATLIDSFSNTAIRTAKYIIQTSDAANIKYQSSEILLCHDGNTSTIAVYGTISTNGNIVGFSSNISSGNVQLYAQSTGANCAVKATKITIAD